MTQFPQHNPTTGGGAPPGSPPESPMPWAMDQSLDSRLGLDASHAPAPTKKRISQGVLFVLAVLVVAAAAVLIMRKTGQHAVNTASAGVEKQIEIALAKLTGKSVTGPDAVAQSTDQVIARFADDPTSHQVGIDHVRKNPFTMTLAVPQSTGDAPVVTVANEDRARQQQQQQLRSELDKLTLQSVMNGRTPLAVISNKVVKTGDVIGPFRVAAIESRAVTLTADGNSYQLTMQSPQLGGQQQ